MGIKVIITEETTTEEEDIDHQVDLTHLMKNTIEKTEETIMVVEEDKEDTTTTTEETTTTTITITKNNNTTTTAMTLDPTLLNLNQNKSNKRKEFLDYQTNDLSN